MSKRLAAGIVVWTLWAGTGLWGQAPPAEPAASALAGEPEAAPELEPLPDTVLMRRTGSSVSRPAEFQGPGLLQLEWSYDGNFGGPDLRHGQTGSISLGFAVNRSLLLEFGFDAVTEATDRLGGRIAGKGDTHAGLQWALLEDGPRQPAVAVAYLSKLPSASALKGLGTGRADHKIALLLSKTLGAEEFDLSLGLLVNGHGDVPGWSRGSLWAVSWVHPLPRGFGAHAEFARQSLDGDLQRGSYALTSLLFQVSRNCQLDAGVRVGLTPETPDLGIFAGTTIGIANLYRKNR